jgi:hypothetical protein
MKKEIKAASSWWRGQLAKKITVVKQLEEFQRHFEDMLQSRYEGHWYVSDPLRGSAFRSISFDQRLDPLLTRTAKAAGIENIEILLSHVRYQVMFVNPGCVKVCNLAYTTPDVIVYEFTESASQSQEVPMEVELKTTAKSDTKSKSKTNGATSKSKTPTTSKATTKLKTSTEVTKTSSKSSSDHGKRTLDPKSLEDTSSDLSTGSATVKPIPPQRKPIHDPSPTRFQPSSTTTTTTPTSTTTSTSFPTLAGGSTPVPVWPSVPPATSTRRPAGPSDSRNVRHVSNQAIPFSSRSDLSSLRPSGSLYQPELVVSNVS